MASDLREYIGVPNISVGREEGVGKVQIYETVDNEGFRVAQLSMDGILFDQFWGPPDCDSSERIERRGVFSPSHPIGGVVDQKIARTSLSWEGLREVYFESLILHQ